MKQCSIRLIAISLLVITRSAVFASSELGMGVGWSTFNGASEPDGIYVFPSPIVGYLAHQFTPHISMQLEGGWSQLALKFKSVN